jgi:hypothetical protein
VPAAKDVNVQMRDGLAAVRAVIDDQTITVLRQTGFFRDFAGFEQDMTKQFAVFGTRFGDARDQFFWKNQDVRRGLGIDVTDSHDQIIFKNNLRRNFPRRDFFKKGFRHADFLFHHKRAFVLLGGQALAQIFDDLFL